MDETKQELLESLGLFEEDGEIIDDYLVIDLYDYDNFNRVYNLLEKDIECERDSDQTSLDDYAAHIVYVYKDILVELVALFESDSYTLNIFEEYN